MVKRCCGLLLALCLLVGLLPVIPGAAALERMETPVQNSDSQAWTQGWGCYVDTMGDGCLVLEREDPSAVSCTREESSPESVRLTDWTRNPGRSWTLWTLRRLWTALPGAPTPCTVSAAAC